MKLQSVLILDSYVFLSPDSQAISTLGIEYLHVHWRCND